MSKYARCPTATGLQLAQVCGQSLDNTRTRRYCAIPVGWCYTLTLYRTGCSVEATSFGKRSSSHPRGAATEWPSRRPGGLLAAQHFQRPAAGSDDRETVAVLYQGSCAAAPTR